MEQLIQILIQQHHTKALVCVRPMQKHSLVCRKQGMYHRGSLQQGHFWAVVDPAKSTDKLVVYDDARVRYAEEGDVLDSEVYMALYVQSPAEPVQGKAGGKKRQRGRSETTNPNTAQSQVNVDNGVIMVDDDSKPQMTLEGFLKKHNLRRVPNAAEINKPGDCLPLTMKDIAEYFNWEQPREENWRELLCDIYEKQHKHLMRKHSYILDRPGGKSCMKEDCKTCQKTIGSATLLKDQICRHVCAACRQGKCLQRPLMTGQSTTVEDFIAWLRQEQRWMSTIEVCTYAEEIVRLSSRKKRLIMIQQGIHSTIRLDICEGPSTYKSDEHSCPWRLVPIQEGDLDANRDVYMVYTGNNHFSFAKPIHTSRKAPETESEPVMASPKVHLHRS